METLSLLKYWHGAGVGAGPAAAAAAAAAAAPIVTAAAAVAAAAAESDDNPNDDDEDDEEDDEGSFFDLEFAVPADDDAVDRESSAADSDDEAEGEFKFDVSGEGPRSGALSPSDDLFFKGAKLVQLEPSSVVIAPSESDPKPQLPISLLKSATKLRVFMLGLRKSRSAAEPDGGAAAAATSPKHQGPGKFFVRFKVEEVPIVSLFTRDNSSRVSASKEAKPAEDAAAEETRFAKEVVKRYLSKIKPLYVRVSKRYGEKLRFATHPRSGGSAAAAARIVAGAEGDETDGEAEGAAAPHTALVACGVKGPRASVPAGLRVVCKRLGKSRSASAAIEAPPQPPPPPPLPQPQQRRRDDSLLQQQDGIQSAIAHCKRSLIYSARGTESPLVRSMSDPGEGRSEIIESGSSD